MKTDKFGWLSDLLASVKTHKFFVAEHIDPRIIADLETAYGKLPEEYKQFVAAYGHLRMFRESYHGYKLTLSKEPRCRADCGASYLGIGYSDSGKHAFYKVDDRESPIEDCIYEGTINLKCTNVGFDKWFETRFLKEKAKYSAKRWNNILNGPRPFSPSEMLVVEARRKYTWKRCGVDNDKKIELLVCNKSNRTLAAYSLSVKVEGKLLGLISLPVRDIKPGESKMLAIDCYSQIVEPGEVMLHDIADPGPEDREHIYEFEGQI